MFCWLSGRFGVLISSHLQSSLFGHGRVRCRALQPHLGLVCSLQPPRSLALCQVPAPCRPCIVSCRCSQVVYNCLTHLLSKQSILGQCRFQSRGFCKLSILFVCHWTQQLCTASPLNLPPEPLFLSISWQVLLQAYTDRRSLWSNRPFCTSCSFS